MDRTNAPDAAPRRLRPAPRHDAITVPVPVKAPNTPSLAVPSKDPMLQPHLVIKRGHLGRYRFTLLTDNGRVSGEVKVATNGASRAEQDALARAEVRALAATLEATTEADEQRG